MPLGQPYSFDAQPPALASFGVAEAENELRALVRAGYRVLVCFPHVGEAQRTSMALNRVDAELLPPGSAGPGEPGIGFVLGSLRHGFVAPMLRFALLPSAQLFRRRSARRAPGLGRALAAFGDLHPGDYVVHEDHGVGRFLQFDTKQVGGVVRDYLHLAFRGEDRLYVPHEQLGKVSRYIGSDGSAPALSKLGGKAWLNLRTRARTAVRELAGELLALYAHRQNQLRPAFPADDEWTARLEASFPYEETDDQQRAIESVTEDMEADRPMDRLVCGDVGFGKTEVAVRAALRRSPAAVRCCCSCPRRCSPPSTPPRSANGSSTSRCGSRWCPGSARLPRSRRRWPTSARARWTCSWARTGRSPATSCRPTSAWSSWTRSSASASPRRSCCGRCAWRWTCWRCRRPRSRARCTCPCRGCATSR